MVMSMCQSSSRMQCLLEKTFFVRKEFGCCCLGERGAEKEECGWKSMPKVPRKKWIRSSVVRSGWGEGSHGPPNKENHFPVGIFQ